MSWRNCDDMLDDEARDAANACGWAPEDDYPASRAELDRDAADTRRWYAPERDPWANARLVTRGGAA